MKIFISGQKYFGQCVLNECLNAGHEVVGVCVPLGDKYLGRAAAIHGLPVINGGGLNYETCPKDFDLGIVAHSFDYVGKRTRAIPKIGWIGYHPSLLPRHRGRSAVEWAIRMRDFITGGTVYWLNAGIDRGDIERQEAVWIDPAHFTGCPAKAAAELWRTDLLPLGIKLVTAAVSDISRGVIRKAKQDARFSTFEPDAGVKDIYKPDLLGLPVGHKTT